MECQPSRKTFKDLLIIKEATAIIQAKLQETSVHISLARKEGEVSELDPNTRRRVCNDSRIHINWSPWVSNPKGKNGWEFNSDVAIKSDVVKVVEKEKEEG
nr:hypothetical protein [Tanacetum cinerariifolium]